MKQSWSPPSPCRRWSASCAASRSPRPRPTPRSTRPLAERFTGPPWPPRSQLQDPRHLARTPRSDRHPGGRSPDPAAAGRGLARERTHVLTIAKNSDDPTVAPTAS